MDPMASRAAEEGSGAVTSVGEKAAVLCPGEPWLKSMPLTYATEAPTPPAVICAGVEVLKKKNVPENPGANAVPELLTHSMELPTTLLPQPKELVGPLGMEGRLLPPWVQPYHKLLRLVEPVFCRRRM